MKNIKACDLKPEYNIIDLRAKTAYSKGHIFSNFEFDFLINENLPLSLTIAILSLNLSNWIKS